MFWSFLKRFHQRPNEDRKPEAKPRPTRCLTMEIRQHSKDPNYRFGLGYDLADGSVLIKYIYPFDGRREIEVVSKEEREKRKL